MKKIGLLCLFWAEIISAQTAFTATTTNTTGSSISYNATIENPSSSSLTSTFTVGKSFPHNFLGTKNRKLTGITIDGKNYLVGPDAPQVYIRRNSASGQVGPNSGNQAIPWNDKQIFYAEGSVDTTNKTINAVTSYPGVVNSTDQPILSLLTNAYINTGIDNLFNNTESPVTNGDSNANNIERVDFIYSTPVKITANNITSGGIVISNRGNNDDPVTFSAIRNLSEGSNTGSGTNFIYSNIIKLNSNWTQKSINGGAFVNLSASSTEIYSMSSVITYRERDTDGALNDKTSTNNPSADNVLGKQIIYGLFFSFQDLGLKVGDNFYGISTAGGDFPATAGGTEMNSYLDPQNFPLKTNVIDGGVDLVVNGLFYLLNVTGNVWNDINSNGVKDNAEPYTNAGGLNTVLINSSNTVLDVAAVDASTGNYKLNNLAFNTSGYKIILTTNHPAIGSTYASGASLPPYWVNTADAVDPSNTAVQGIELGVIELSTQTNDVTNQNFGIKLTYCFKPAATSGATLPTKFGITSLGRAGEDNKANWPMVRTGAWAALESKTKGFVINRLTSTQKNALIPVEGMMVYDTDLDCLSIYNGTMWRCYSNPTCPD
jgi:hypothetical protein